MGFKSFFINEDEEQNVPKQTPPTQEKSNVFKMPDSMSSTPVVMESPVSNMVIAPSSEIASHSEIEKAMTLVSEVYKNGMKTLNKEGYDFYEFFSSIQSINGNTPEAYNMAFNLGNSMSKTPISTSHLIETGKFYLSELVKVGNDFEVNGVKKLNSIQEEKDNKKATLLSTIEAQQLELQRMTLEISNTQAQINGIDEEFKTKINEVTLKIEANKNVRASITSEISYVIDNITKYIK